MLHRTLLSAQRERDPFASWKHKVIVEVTVAGRRYWRTYVFDSSYQKCKRCRKAGSQPGRVGCSGATCDRCGNPFAGFTRQTRSNRSGAWKSLGPACYGDFGPAH
jgi:hypothetical protein